MADLKKLFKPLHPLLRKKTDKHYFYGTSGYRTAAAELDPIVARVALVAYVRSSTLCGRHIGLMITASHNPPGDNGIKLIDHNGDMFDQQWEALCDELVNCADADLHATLGRMYRRAGSGNALGLRARILVGRDTRLSGEHLSRVAMTVLGVCNATAVDLGIVSTPQLHWLVQQANFAGQQQSQNKNSGQIDPAAYVRHIAACAQQLGTFSCEVAVDTAAGVSRQVMEALREHLDLSKVTLWDGPGLNDGCGADFVKRRGRPPASFPAKELNVSFDGDMDRLLFFRTNPFALTDGDALCAHFARYFAAFADQLRVGAVMSDYSNSAAVDFVRQFCPVVVAATGIRNFVNRAREFDIGIYFEPNGHGGVFFSTAAARLLDARGLGALHRIFNPSIGDPLAVFVVAQLVLGDLAVPYTPLPVRLLSVPVESVVTVELDAQKRVVRPTALAAVINDLVEKNEVRVFVRSSGTERLVRVFVEGNSRELCDVVAVSVAQAVYDACGGVGVYPEISYFEES